MHFVAEPAAFPAIFRYGAQDLSMGPAIADFSVSFFGMSKKGVSIFDSNARKANMEALHKYFIKPGGLRDLTTSAQRFISDQLDTILKRIKTVDTASASSTTLDLYDLVRKTIFYTTLKVTISESESVVNEDFVALFECFDKAIPKAFAGLPLKYVASESYRAREQLVQILQNDSFVPSKYLLERHAFLSDKGMSIDDIARDNLLWVWGAGTNFIPSQFWHIYHIVCSRDALVGIRREVDNIIAQRKNKEGAPADDQFDGIFTTQELDKMVGLESAFKESNRLTMTNMIVREVMRDMDLDLRLAQREGSSSKYFVEKGSTVVLYPPLLHQDPHVFEKPKEYRWNRFMKDQLTGKAPQFKNASGEVIRDPFRGFGGGAHYCPGRKMAGNIAKAFAASLVYQYDMELVGSPTEFDFARDAFGVLKPKSHVEIRFSPRK